jgi:malonate transporter and related proteins
MLQTVFSILPIFLLIMIGLGLKLVRLMDDQGWRALDQLSFFLLYPVLLFVTIIKADFSGLAVPELMATLGLPWFMIGAALLAAAPFLVRRGAMVWSQFSSVFQTTVRWNGFVALAVAERQFSVDAAAVVALVMAALVIPINLAAIYVVVRHAGGETPGFSATIRRMAANPIVLACLSALALRSTGLALPEPILTTLDLIGRGALAMGLIGIGAGLTLAALIRPQWATVLPTILKLVVMPGSTLALITLSGWGTSLAGVIILCAAVPTAMNGYVVARQLGGDAPLYAAVVTIQTLLSFFTIPIWLWIATH